MYKKFKPANGLTPRELEVLSLFKQGLTNQQIADELSLTLNTVKKTHMPSIYKKMDLVGYLDGKCGHHKGRLLMAKIYQAEMNEKSRREL